MEINLQRELDFLLSEISALPKPPSLFIHICCAPCASYVLEYLSEYFTIKLCFYNPNIYPESEYSKRLDTLNQLISDVHFKNGVELIASPYIPQDFYNAAAGLEHEPEGGSRCIECFRLRLGYSSKLAAELNCDYFTTSLSISPHKNAALLYKLCKEAAQNANDKYMSNLKTLPADFKKKGGYQRSIALCRELGLYRQNYCGCEFSITPVQM